MNPTREAQPSATPRTDAETGYWSHLGQWVTRAGDWSVKSDFARTLETELKQANARERDLKDELARCKQLVSERTEQANGFEQALIAAQAENARLAADSARIDWLQAQEVKRALETGTHSASFDHLVLAEDGTTCWGKTYREALDSAMRSGGEGASHGNHL